MSYAAAVFRVLIASPSDVQEERNMIRDMVYRWNDVHSPRTSVVLLPVLWETHAVPEMGDRPQAIINKQLVENTDVLIGVFWTKLGTHTGRAESGTAEEIEEFRRQGKPVLLYFSSRPVVPGSIDAGQFQRLQDYKQVARSEGLVWDYAQLDDLRSYLDRHLTETANRIAETTPAAMGANDDTSHERSRLFTLVRGTRIRWESERDADPVSVEGGKSIIRSLAENLVEYLVASQDSLDPQIMGQIQSKIVEARELQGHLLFLDGGRSYRAFWSKGDALLDDLTELAESQAA